MTGSAAPSGEVGPQPFGALAVTRTVIGVSCWLCQLAIGGWALHLKASYSFGVVLTFLYGIPVDLVLFMWLAVCSYPRARDSFGGSLIGDLPSRRFRSRVNARDSRHGVVFF